MSKYGVPVKIDGKLNPEYTRRYNLAKGKIKDPTKPKLRGSSSQFGVPSVIDGKQNPEYYRLYRQAQEKEKAREYRREYQRGLGYEAMRLGHWRHQGSSIDSYGQFLTLLAMAGYQCEICRTALTVKDAYLDHVHSSGRVRGVLCNHCNRGLGCFYDSPIAIQRAATYIEEG